MSLLGFAEKKRIAELEKQLNSQQQIIDNLIKLSEKSVNTCIKSHNIAENLISILKKVTDDLESLKDVDKDNKKTGA